MLNIDFQGWWQLRMASDPDPADHPTGVSGKTFWVPGEPYLEPTIRLQDPLSPRFPHESDIGVTVAGVSLDDPAAPGGRRALPRHPLLGARVNLLDGPRFEERGFVVVYQVMPIAPFQLEIAGNGLRLYREDLFDITRPTLSFEDVASFFPELIIRRSAQIYPQDTEVAEATGIMDYAGYRRQRLADLERRLDETTDPTQRAALEKRIDELQKDHEGFVGSTLAAQQFLGLKGVYGFSLNGPLVVDDRDGLLGGDVGTSMEWPISFWMGAYDVDSLCGFMRGTLSVPFYPHHHP